ncbi:MAG: hypothetical protein ACP5RN_06460 [Armatimonadota bacterium]
MELVRVVVKRRSTDGGTELNINVQATPIGSLLAGATAIWIGTKMLRMFRRRLWLPLSAGVAMLALRRLYTASSTREEQVEDHASS